MNLPGPLSKLNERVDAGLRMLDRGLAKVMTVFIVLGVLLSCMHQSSLGTLMVIADGKLHPLWQTPMLPMLFLLSAFAVGFPMVIFESILASKSLHLRPEREMLGKLAAYIPMLLGVYFAAKLIDLLNRGSLGYAFEGTLAGNMFLLEVGLGVVIPFFILTNAKRRRSVRWLMTGATLVIFGVVMNRLNVFLIGYTPTGGQSSYFPSFGEIAVTAGFIALIVLIYRFVVFNFPVIEHFKEHQA
mgnify:FL=1